MTPTQLISIAVLAVLVFWAVGAYNRLVRLKNRLAQLKCSTPFTLGKRAP